MEDELKQKLFRNTKSGWENTTEEQRKDIEEVSKNILDFLNKAKIEREFITNAKKLADENVIKILWNWKL